MDYPILHRVQPPYLTLILTPILAKVLKMQVKSNGFVKGRREEKGGGDAVLTTCQ